MRKKYTRGPLWQWYQNERFNQGTTLWKKDHREVIMDTEESPDSPETWGLI